MRGNKGGSENQLGLQMLTSWNQAPDADKVEPSRGWEDYGGRGKLRDRMARTGKGPVAGDGVQEDCQASGHTGGEAVWGYS